MNTGTKDEIVLFDKSTHMSRAGVETLDYDDRICQYYHQRNKALAASHSVINYAMFLSLLGTGLFPTRSLLILDECHELPSEVLIDYHRD